MHVLAGWCHAPRVGWLRTRGCVEASISVGRGSSNSFRHALRSNARAKAGCPAAAAPPRCARPRAQQIGKGGRPRRGPVLAAVAPARRTGGRACAHRITKGAMHVSAVNCWPQRAPVWNSVARRGSQSRSGPVAAGQPDRWVLDSAPMGAGPRSSSQSQPPDLATAMVRTPQRRSYQSSTDKLCAVGSNKFVSCG